MSAGSNLCFINLLRPHWASDRCGRPIRTVGRLETKIEREKFNSIPLLFLCSEKWGKSNKIPAFLLHQSWLSQWVTGSCWKIWKCFSKVLKTLGHWMENCVRTGRWILWQWTSLYLIQWLQERMWRFFTILLFNRSGSRRSLAKRMLWSFNATAGHQEHSQQRWGIAKDLYALS